MQRHPRLGETDEVEHINTYILKQCPYCGEEQFFKYGIPV